jgi:hypothetical protein
VNAKELITTLGIIESAPSDTVRAKVFLALDRYAVEVGNGELIEAARAAMPKADPFTPPGEWRDFYDEGFQAVADEEGGVYIDTCTATALNIGENLAIANARRGYSNRRSAVRTG